MSAARIDFDLFDGPLDGVRLIEASAGTGKTWSIAGLFLRLLLEERREVDRILVVTFTNAAMAELRERIRRNVAACLRYVLAGSAPDDPMFTPLIDAVVRRTGMAQDEMARLLRAALANFDEAAISTIHGFCQRALAEKPFASGQPLHVELVADDADLRAQVVQDFWRRHVAHGALPVEVVDYLIASKDSPETWGRMLARHIAKPMSRVVWPEFAAGDIVALAGSLRERHARASALWAQQGVDVVAAVQANAHLLNKTTYSEKAIAKALECWSQWMAPGAESLSTDVEVNTRYRLFCASHLVGKLNGGKKADRDEMAAKARQVSSHEFFHIADELVAANDALLQAIGAARLGLLRNLFAEGTDALRASKRERRMVTFDDLLQGLHDALVAPGGEAFAATLRARHPVALIDEFQDTDPLQYAIFERIYRPADAEGPAGPLFLVGDPKQAIYSFRNADLHTYLAAARQVDSVSTLRENQRSTAGLVDAGNALFGRNRQAFLLPGLDYVAVTEGAKKRTCFEDETGVPAAALVVWRPVAGAAGSLPDRPTLQEGAVRATANEIARLLEGGRSGRVRVDGRGLQPAQIAVLVRSHAQGQRIKLALADVGVASVERSQSSIFDTVDAQDLARVLAAIVEPGRHRVLFAALATELMGYDAAAIARAGASDVETLGLMTRFEGYREVWLRRGFAVMAREWIDGEGVGARLLARADGERRLTNLLHLLELLQTASVRRPAPEALLRWYATECADAGRDEVAQLRLESDAQLVQILTIHKAKGLEFDVVFCPFLWDAHRGGPGRDAAGIDYHDDEGRPVLDFRPDVGEDETVEARRRLESDAETLRLFYVALTRAVHRAYLVAGCYTVRYGKTASTTSSTRGMLNWLVAGDGIPYATWIDNKFDALTIEAQWDDFIGRSGADVLSSPLRTGTAYRFEAASIAPDALAALPPPRQLPRSWRLGSYSSLTARADPEAGARDHDAATGARGIESIPSTIDSTDILRFPRGPNAGDCVHAVLERLDWTDPRRWDSAIVGALRAHPQEMPEELGADEAGARWRAMLRGMLESLARTALPDGLMLGRVAPTDTIVECPFFLSARLPDTRSLGQWLDAHGHPQPPLERGSLTGYLRGFIDLVVRHGERFYVIDWKSNHLGFTAHDYGEAAMAEAMAEHGYHLQALIYCVALHRHLSRSLPGYDFDRHFGGFVYLFVRGVRPSWVLEGKAAGIFHRRPQQAEIESFDALLSGRVEEAG